MKNLSSRLKHKVELQQAIETSDGIGGIDIYWQKIAELWAEILPYKGNEHLLNAAVSEVINCKITVRYRTDIHHNMRFIMGDRIFNILSIMNHNEENKSLIIYAQEVK